MTYKEQKVICSGTKSQLSIVNLSKAQIVTAKMFYHPVDVTDWITQEGNASVNVFVNDVIVVLLLLIVVVIVVVAAGEDIRGFDRWCGCFQWYGPMLSRSTKEIL